MGIALFLASAIINLFSAAIMIIIGLRIQYWNWGFVSLALSIAFYVASRYFRNNLGYVTMENHFDKYTFNHLLGSVTKISKPEIYAISVTKQPVLWGLMGEKPVVLINTYNKNIALPIYRFQNTVKIQHYFEEIADLIHDEYYSVILKNEVTFPTLYSRIWRSKKGKFAILILITYLIFALWGVFSMILYPSNVLRAKSLFLRNPEITNSFLPGYTSRTIIYVPPNSDFLLGTDFNGRDVFSRLIYGTTHTLAIAFAASVIFIILVMVLGYGAAFSQGALDEIISRIADTLLIFPPIIPIIILATYAINIPFAIPEFYFYFIFILLSLLTWPRGMKLLRSETKRLLSEEYVAAARLLGASNYDIIFKHVIPKTFPTIIYLFVYSVTEVILGTTVIGLLGLGSLSNLTWGSDLEKAIVFTDVPLKNRWWTVIFPSIWVSFLVIGLTIVSDLIRNDILYRSEAAKGLVR